MQNIGIILQIQKVKAEIGEYANNPEALLLEAVHSAGYTGPLANPLLASEGILNRINSTVLEEFVAVSLFFSSFKIVVLSMWIMFLKIPSLKF